MSVAVRVALGAVLGAAVGYGVYRFIGCRTGACPLTGHPVISSVWWAIIGIMMALSPR